MRIGIASDGLSTRSLEAGLAGSYSLEERILLSCATVRLAGRRREVFESLLRQPVDWSKLLRASQWHRLSGFLFHHLRDTSFRGLVPGHVFADLRGVYFVTTARHLRDRSELERVLARLAAEGIPVILLKGAALVGTVYPEAGLRPMGDVDLLVPRPRLDDAQVVVQRTGYAPMEEGRDERWAFHQHLPRLVGTEHSVAIEIHGHVVRLDGPVAFDIQDFWDRSQRSTSTTAPARELAAEDMVLHLCLSFFRDRLFHSRGALRQLCDIAEVVRQRSIRWDAVVDRSRSYGIAGPVACSLRLSAMLLEAPLPAWVAPALSPNMADLQLATFARRRVMPTTRWHSRALLTLHGRYPGLGVVGSLVRRLVPSREYMRRRYGGDGIEKYWRRMAYWAEVFVRAAQRPSEVTEDRRVERWMRSLYEPKPIPGSDSDRGRDASGVSLA